MVKHFMSIALVSAASLAFVAGARAEDIPATPMNHGPMMMGGMAVPPVNVFAPLDAIMGKPATASPMMEKPMMKHHMMKHHMSKKTMMKKEMMKKGM